MEDPKRPERLFRYFPPEASSFFSDKKLWFSSLKGYNDPFDGLPRFDVMMESQLQEIINQEYAFVPPDISCDFKAFKKAMKLKADAFLDWGVDALPNKYRDIIGDRFRLICFSETHDDLLMWGHYAKGHTGFVVQFDPSHQMFTDDELGKVQYPETSERLAIAPHDQTADELWRILFCKSPHWKYEREWRLVEAANRLQEGERTSDRNRMRFINLPVDSVLAIYIGWQMPTEAADNLILPLRATEWNRVRKFQMRPSRAKYGVEPVSWEEWINRPKFKTSLDKLIPISTQQNSRTPGS